MVSATPAVPMPLGNTQPNATSFNNFAAASRPLLNWADNLVEAKLPPTQPAKEDQGAYDRWMASQYHEQKLRHEQIMRERDKRQQDESMKRQLLQKAEAEEEARGELSMWHMV